MVGLEASCVSSTVEPVEGRVGPDGFLVRKYRLTIGHRAHFMIISTNATRTATVVTDTAGTVTVR